MKYCYKCDETKTTSEFHKNKRRPDGLQNYCKACAKARNRAYYLATPERNPQRQASRDKARTAARQLIADHLRQHPCVDCGEADPIVLEFDHVRGTKLANIADMVGNSTIEALEAEIAKCDVRCANCHRRVTAQRAGWYVSLV